MRTILLSHSATMNRKQVELVLGKNLEQRIELCGVSKSQSRLDCKRSSNRRPQHAEQLINSRQITKQSPTRAFTIDHWRGTTEVQIHGRHGVFFKRLGGSRHRLKIIADDLSDRWPTSRIFRDGTEDRFLRRVMRGDTKKLRKIKVCPAVSCHQTPKWQISHILHGSQRQYRRRSRK